MTLMWRSGTSLQKLVLSFYYAGPRGNQTQPSGLTEPFHLSNLTLENHLMYNFLLYFYLIGNYMFQKAKKKKCYRVFFILVFQHIEHLFQEVARVPVSWVSARAVPACPCQPLVFAHEHVLLLHSCVFVQTIHSTRCCVHHSFCVVPLGATYVLYKVISTSK